MTFALCALSASFGFLIGLIGASILILATEDRDQSKRTRKGDKA